MNKISYFIITVCLIAGAAAGADDKQPNVLFIFADDMCYEAIGAHGIVDIDTPHLDTLVEKGTSFTHAYNMGAWGGAVCVASRTMLNTGRFVWNAKKTDLKKHSDANLMWSQRMAGAGYRTYLSGKWHVPTDAPELFDFAKNVRPGMPTHHRAGYNRPKDKAHYEAGWKPWDTQYGGFWEGGKHWSEVLADDGAEFLAQAAKDENPFFMYLAFNAPHDPRQAPKEYIDRYPLERIKVPESMLAEYPYAEAICGRKLRDEALIPYPRTEYSVKVNRQEYFALITHMDDQIGKILDALEKTGKVDNTYIIFTADHGLAVGHHGLVGKQNMYDHSVRVPFLMVGPKVPAGAKVDTPIYLQDVVPTSLSLAGASTDDVEFKSVLPLLNNESQEHYSSIYGAYMGKQRMITRDGWKLIAYPEIGVTRLFDLKNDPQEMSDLAANPEYSEKLTSLTSELENEMGTLNDPMSSLSAADYKRPIKSKKKDKH